MGDIRYFIKPQVVQDEQRTITAGDNILLQVISAEANGERLGSQ